MGAITKIRCFLIKALSGDMPVVLNVTISRPNGCSGPLVSLPDTFEGVAIFNCVTLLNPGGCWDFRACEGYESRA